MLTKVNYNKKHPNGRINIEIGKNYIVSPYDECFIEQIESGVRDSVLALLKLGYLTVGSCDGKHSIKEAAHVSIAFVNERSLIETALHLSDLGVYYYIDKSYNFVKAETLNKLFFRNVEKYYFLTVCSFNAKRKVMPYLLLPFRNILRKKLTDKLSQLPRYEY